MFGVNMSRGEVPEGTLNGGGWIIEADNSGPLEGALTGYAVCVDAP